MGKTKGVADEEVERDGGVDGKGADKEGGGGDVRISAREHVSARMGFDPGRRGGGGCSFRLYLHLGRRTISNATSLR